MGGSREAKHASANCEHDVTPAARVGTSRDMHVIAEHADSLHLIWTHSG